MYISPPWVLSQLSLRNGVNLLILSKGSLQKSNQVWIRYQHILATKKMFASSLSESLSNYDNFWVVASEDHRTNIKGIHLYLSPNRERNSCHNVKRFLFPSNFSSPDYDSHVMSKRIFFQYVAVQILFIPHFFLISFSFLFSFQK